MSVTVHWICLFQSDRENSHEIHELKLKCDYFFISEKRERKSECWIQTRFCLRSFQAVNCPIGNFNSMKNSQKNIIWRHFKNELRKWSKSNRNENIHWNVTNDKTTKQNHPFRKSFSIQKISHQSIEILCFLWNKLTLDMWHRRRHHALGPHFRRLLKHFH